MNNQFLGRLAFSPCLMFHRHQEESTTSLPLQLWSYSVLFTVPTAASLFAHQPILLRHAGRSCIQETTDRGLFLRDDRVSQSTPIEADTREASYSFDFPSVIQISDCCVVLCICIAGAFIPVFQQPLDLLDAISLTDLSEFACCSI